MTFNRLALAVCLLLGFAAISVNTASAKDTKEATKQAKAQQLAPDIPSFVLDNGMQVVVIPDRRAPVVTHMVWYKAGSADEPPGKSGIAHYLEHLMFKGTKNVKSGEFSARIASIGGQENAFTSYDYTAYFQRVTPEALEEMMRLEADRMENLVLRQEDILAERDVVNEERNARTENNPGSLLREAMNAALYQNHRYGIPIIGWQHEMNSLTKQDAIDFYDRFYTPNNAVLVVAGDVDAAAVRELAEKTYGKVARRAEPGERVRPSEPTPRAARRVIMDDPRVSTPSFSRQYLVPSYNTAADREAEALEVLSEILAGGSTGRMYRALVIDQRIASNAGAWYQGGALDSTEFGFWGSPRPDKTLEELEAATDQVIADVLKDGVTQAEVERAQNRLIRSAVFARDSQATLARIYGGSLTLGSTLEEIASWPDDIRSVTVEDVNAAARKYLQLKRSVTGFLRPSPAQEG
ncbi:MAG: pitrilysin family protein [Ahrensia sp.]|nr:pitrilysin family protein [Ahrensia sp.]